MQTKSKASLHDGSFEGQEGVRVGAPAVSAAFRQTTSGVTSPAKRLVCEERGVDAGGRIFYNLPSELQW